VMEKFSGLVNGTWVTMPRMGEGFEL
jgi:hypothetical protein